MGPERVKRPFMKMANEKLLVTGDGLTVRRGRRPRLRQACVPCPLAQRTSQNLQWAWRGVCGPVPRGGFLRVVYSAHQELRLQEGPKCPHVSQVAVAGILPAGTSPSSSSIKGSSWEARNLKRKEEGPRTGLIEAGSLGAPSARLQP